MTIAAITTGPYQGYLCWPNHGMSDEAKSIRNEWSGMIAGLYIVDGFQSRISAVIGLRDLLVECSEDNWDGEGAAVITAETCTEAASFLCSLPVSQRTPDVLPEPNGSIGFEWQFGRKVFVVSVSGKRRLSFAGVFGPDEKVHGTEPFIEGIPASIINYLQRLR